jgi:hypothetical protein
LGAVPTEISKDRANFASVLSAAWLDHRKWLFDGRYSPSCCTPTVAAASDIGRFSLQASQKL